MVKRPVGINKAMLILKTSAVII
ncbi:hypothetical protein EMIT0111MI5_20380 [Burkholderia sp. IT-111MI5]